MRVIQKKLTLTNEQYKYLYALVYENYTMSQNDIKLYQICYRHLPSSDFYKTQLNSAIKRFNIGKDILEKLEKPYA